MSNPVTDHLANVRSKWAEILAISSGASKIEIVVPLLVATENWIVLCRA
jgi:hypothetical protein